MILRTGFRAPGEWSVPRWPAALGLTGATAVMWYSAFAEHAATWGMGVGLVALALASFALVHTRARRDRKLEIQIDADGVWFHGEMLRRAQIATAQFADKTKRDGARVRFIDRRGVELAWVEVASRAEADRAIAALEMSPEKTTTHFAVVVGPGAPSRPAHLTRALGLAAAIFAVLAGQWVLAIALLAATTIGYHAFLGADVEIGADGLFYRTRVGPQFFRWNDVERVEAASGRWVIVTLKNGNVVNIPLTAFRGFDANARTVQAALVDRANEALTAFRARAAPGIAAQLARAGRSKEEWLAALREREGNFREAPLRADDLWAIVESPAADASARAGAAAVLARAATDEELARFRIAADACAEPKLRVVLDRAATGEDVEEALDQIDERQA